MDQRLDFHGPSRRQVGARLSRLAPFRGMSGPPLTGLAAGLARCFAELVLAVDGTPSGCGAQDLAITLARRKGAAITGVGVVDRAWATAPRATPLGGGADRKVLADSGERPTRSSAISAKRAAGPARRAMPMFVLLGLAQELEVHVVSVAPTKDVADSQFRARGGAVPGARPATLTVSHADAAAVSSPRSRS